ncbi:MAG: hypothetical protein GWN18_14995 [Thermoplasmata archaeon]|nr:hypothetical protein [Thermoplasmata archaeon]NIS13372.1 hypothetical protein [Thermoplasmata archaeon]NIS21257.1 hypothetical protein [Thermoplasmata archaeon]NIT78759.1 hypothetical protein [Thermoplasmata archaeon]NIU50310.1 hypothetical protein [Thermoplasmata archaeon]
MEGYEYEGVYSVKDSYPMEGHFSVYLVVENPEGPGTEPDDNATVEVSWQVGTVTSWTTVLIITAMALALSAVIVLLRSHKRRSGSSRGETDQGEVSVDGESPSSGAVSRARKSEDPPGGHQWCRSCGAEMTWDGTVDWWVCANCGRELGPGT